MSHLTGFLGHLLKAVGVAVTGVNQASPRGDFGGALNDDLGRGTPTSGTLGLLLGKNKKARKLASVGGLIAGPRMVDTGAMPTITSGNTNSPTLMMAEKAARWMGAATP